MDAIQGYTGGLNQDGALNKRTPNSYYYLKNFRVTTDEGLSTGSLENEKGHVLSFTLPNLLEMEITTDSGNTVTIPAQTNLKIIGWCTLREYIIVFSTSETSENPTNSVGQIWKLRYDESTNTVENISSGSLTVANHLLYNQFVNFSTYHRIKAVGRYENSGTQRIYFTDYYNNLRSYNTALTIGEPGSLSVDLSSLDVLPDIYFTQANIENIGNGSLPTQAMVQVCYRAISEEGAASLYSPPTPLIPLTEQSVTSNDFNSFTGEGTGNSRSITYNLKGLDTRYSIIEHIIIIYNETNVATIYKFKEENIPSDGELVVTCDSIADAEEILLVEFNILSSGFEVVKDIESKGNRLIVANIKNRDFELDYDARVYRFDSTQEALLYDTQNNLEFTIDGTAPVYPNNTTEAELDLINPYNNENDVNWSTSSQYKYKTDGITLGGEGPNISYEFVKEPMLGNTSLIEIATQDAPHLYMTTFNSGDGTNTLNVIDSDGSTKEIVRLNQFKNFASQWAVTNFKGGARGETYRYGIVFYNKKGTTSFVKWIGDIRFPDVEDGYPIQDFVGGIPTLYSIGIEFTVDISSIRDEISAYSIVRVQRGVEDRSKLGTGMFQYMSTIDEGGSVQNTLIENWYFNNGTANNTYTDRTEILGTDYNGNFVLMDMPGFHNSQINDNSFNIGHLISPVGQLYNVDFKTGDYIRTTGYYDSYAYMSDLDPLSTGENDVQFFFSYKLTDFTSNSNSELFEIANSKILSEGEVIFSSDPNYGSYITPNNLINASYGRQAGGGANEYVPFGVGAQKLILFLDNSPGLVTAQNPNTTDWSSPGDTGYYGFLNFPASALQTTNEVRFKEVVYARYLNDQYGGNSFIARSKNQYISTGHFQSLNEFATTPIPDSLTFKVFGGDVFVNYYDEEYISPYYNTILPYKESSSNKLGIAVMMPCESLVNTNFRGRVHFASDRDGNNTGAYQFNSVSMAGIFSQENHIEQKFFAQDFLLNIINEFPHTLWASELKSDGELLDSWRIFKTANKTELEGIYGPINRIINFKDRLFFYQERAFGTASIDERSLITDDSGQQLVLGTGGVFPSYDYLSTNTGVSHQYAVVATENALYHFDARLRKFMQFTGSTSQLSDVKGMSSFFDREVTGSIINSDYTAHITPLGIHAEVDHRYNRVLFTFLGDNPFTVSYSEMLNAFEGFYGYTPGLYLDTKQRLLSVSPLDKNRSYLHNEGEYCSFYGEDPEPSILNTIFGNGNNIKIYTNLNFLSEVYDTNGDDIYDETISTLRIYNEYQDTGVVDLTYDDNIRRRMRTWRHQVERDNTDNQSRIRNPWVNCLLTYENNNNKRLVLHELTYSFTPSQF